MCYSTCLPTVTDNMTYGGLTHSRIPQITPSRANLDLQLDEFEILGIEKIRSKFDTGSQKPRKIAIIFRIVQKLIDNPIACTKFIAHGCMRQLCKIQSYLANLRPFLCVCHTAGGLTQEFCASARQRTNKCSIPVNLRIFDKAPHIVPLRKILLYELYPPK
jgi:hypothetical protein